MILELCKGVHCVDLGESFQTYIFLQNFASIQPRTSPIKFARSSGAAANHRLGPAYREGVRREPAGDQPGEGGRQRGLPTREGRDASVAVSLNKWVGPGENFEGLVLGCIDAGL